jgi:hypothetical protein
MINGQNVGDNLNGLTSGLIIQTQKRLNAFNDIEQARGLLQGCQMVCFQTKITIWVNFGGH